MKLPRLPRKGSILEAKYTEKQMREYAMKAVLQERNDCFSLAKQMSETEANMNQTWRNGCDDVANAIRARKQA